MERGANGRTIVITGGSSGIGAAAARALAAGGDRVVITGRSPATRALAEEIGADAYLVDYESFAEVRAFAEALLERYPRIDALVNNAGALYGQRRLTPDGHERTLQVDHLSGFLLTNLLRGRLEESHAVVVNTASGAHRFAPIDFDDLENARDYNGFRAYAAAKRMNILHAIEVERRFQGVHAASFHPGGVATRFGRGGSLAVKLIYDTPLKYLLLTSPRKGADTLLWLLAGEPGRDWAPGGYYYRRKPGRLASQITPETARRLWEASEGLLAESPGSAASTRGDAPAPGE